LPCSLDVSMKVMPLSKAALTRLGLSGERRCRV
jgi:hypothetical protein